MRVPILRGLVSLLPFLPRLLLPRRELLLQLVHNLRLPPLLPLVISTSDPSAALSEAMKDDSYLVVTPSSIPSSATRGPNVDLSSEGSKEVFENLDDKPTMKKKISDSEEEGDEHEAKTMGMYLSYFC